MDKKLILKIAGAVGIVLGAVALFLAGTSADAVTAVAGGVFILAGLVAALFK